MKKIWVDPVVARKHRIQKELLMQAGGDLRLYSELVGKSARAAIGEYGLKVKFAKPLHASEERKKYQSK